MYRSLPAQTILLEYSIQQPYHNYAYPFGIEEYRIGDKAIIYSRVINGEMRYIGKLSVIKRSPAYIYEEDGLGFENIFHLPITYYINEQGTEDIPRTDEFQAIINAFQTWENDTYSYVDFTYGGTTSNSPDVYDGVNVVGWIPNHDGPGGVLAYCAIWYDGTQIVEADIVFDDAETWCIGSDIDVQTVATHEVGHLIGLDDLHLIDNQYQVMYYIYTGIKWDLNLGDVRGVRYLYPIVSRNGCKHSLSI
ncbi:MAG: M10 family metallopeptidase domain-containing protein [archaeon GB-1867-005]|nr:M10 family metallopeptidase domain-containing protein [Candidatus Culexmicrobium cathedralense]